MMFFNNSNFGLIYYLALLILTMNVEHLLTIHKTTFFKLKKSLLVSKKNLIYFDSHSFNNLILVSIITKRKLKMFNTLNNKSHIKVYTIYIYIHARAQSHQISTRRRQNKTRKLTQKSHN